MAKELGYVWITPYSLLKSRTGGIIGRLLSYADIDLVGAHMFAPTDEFIDRYNETIQEANIDEGNKNALLTYMNEHFRPSNRLGIVNRAMMLLVEGENIQDLKDKVVGSLTSDPRGDTIRGTYGDYLGYITGELKYFEPAVLTATTPEMKCKQLELFAEFANSDGGCLEHVMPFEDRSVVQTPLVIIKPEQFDRRSPRVGNIIDTFSQTGLYIVGSKVLRLTTAQAEEFYGPLRKIFTEKLQGLVGDLEDGIKEKFDCVKPDGRFDQISEFLYDLNAENEFNRIVEYMSGTSPSGLTDEQKDQPGGAKCLALLYQGEDAIEKIRQTLGATDPNKAEAGTVRSFYGTDLMRNSAHASDSPESFDRERGIVGLAPDQVEWSFVDRIREYLESQA